MKTRTLASLAVLAAVFALTACGGSSHPAAANAANTASAATKVDPNGMACAALGSNGYCPGDASPAPAPADSTDPNGQQCPSLDSQGYCPGDDPPSAPAAPTMTKQTDVIVFRVKGYGSPDVQYGTDSSDNNESAVGLPWHASAPYDSNALYYYVNAQLNGYGSITDQVEEVVTTWCSPGGKHTETFDLADGSASGGYAIANAEYTGGDTGNAAQAESDAGC